MSERNLNAAPPSGGSPTRIQSVARAVRILVYVAEAAHPPSAKDVSTMFGLPLPTAYHLLNTLVAEEMLAKDAGRRYHVGHQVGVLSDALRRDLTVPERLLVPLGRLAERTNETTYVSGWRAGEIVVLASIEGSHALRVTGLHSGFRGNAHARASGKLLLALAPPDVREAYLRAHPLLAVTVNSIVDPDAIESEFNRVRERGYAFDEEEFHLGVAGVSAPVTNGSSVIAAYTVSAPVHRFQLRRQELTEAVLETAASASSDSDASVAPDTDPDHA